MSLAAIDLNRKHIGSRLLLLRGGTVLVVVITVSGLERVVRIDLIHDTWYLLVLHTRTIFSASPRVHLPAPYSLCVISMFLLAALLATCDHRVGSLCELSSLSAVSFPFGALLPTFTTVRPVFRVCIYRFYQCAICYVPGILKLSSLSSQWSTSNPFP